jgi:hypothetical protein
MEMIEGGSRTRMKIKTGSHMRLPSQYQAGIGMEKSER